jgi:hypothetical protein
MSELGEMQLLLVEIADHVKSGSKRERRKAAIKLQQLAGIAMTLGFTLRPRI